MSLLDDLEQPRIQFKVVNDLLIAAGCQYIPGRVGDTGLNDGGHPGPAAHVYMRLVDGEVKMGHIITYHAYSEVPLNEAQQVAADVGLKPSPFDKFKKK